MKKKIHIIILSLVSAIVLALTTFVFHSAGFSMFWAIVTALILFFGTIILTLFLNSLE